ncbi:hypothetical protein U1Q18_025686 [Sarracenia purpurea var. burkii]
MEDLRRELDFASPVKGGPVNPEVKEQHDIPVVSIGSPKEVNVEDKENKHLGVIEVWDSNEEDNKVEEMLVFDNTEDEERSGSEAKPDFASILDEDGAGNKVAGEGDLEEADLEWVKVRKRRSKPHLKSKVDVGREMKKSKTDAPPVVKLLGFS